MNLADLEMLGIILLFSGLIIAFIIINTRREGNNIRELSALVRLQRAIDLAVEDGTRTHLSLGNSDFTQTDSAAALVGLSILKRVTDVAADSDKPPIATSGTPLTTFVAQDTLRSSYSRMGALDYFDLTFGRVAGLTPFSYAAGTFPIIRDEDVSANLLFGTFGIEIALLAAAGQSKDAITLGGTANLPAQAILFAAADDELIGEEIFAGGAYLGAGSAHIASLHAQDVIRLLLIGAIVLSTLGGLITLF